MAEADETLIARAADMLRAGRPVGVPTDTQYALSVLAADPAAVQRCFDLKGRPGGEPMPIFLPDLDWLERLTEVDEGVRALATAVWPGSLTLVLPRRSAWTSAAAPGDTVALRIPDHPVAAALLRAVGEPITGSSANRHGDPAALTAEAVQAAFGNDVMVLPINGMPPAGAASTILQCAGGAPRILRQGAVPETTVAALATRFLAQPLGQAERKT